MSSANYSFNFCKNILNKSSNKKTIPTKRGDIIAVPDYLDENLAMVFDGRKKVLTPVQQHDKLSNSTISDFGNSFNSDIKSFLKKGKNENTQIGEITFPEFEDNNISLFHIDKSIEKTKGRSKFHNHSLSNRENDINNMCFKPILIFNSNYIETVHQINSARLPRPISGVLPNLYMLGQLPKNYEDDPHVYSDKKFHPVSFLNHQSHTGFTKEQDTLESPSPTIIEYSDFCIRPDLSKAAILSGMAIDNKLGLILVDPVLSNKFKGIVEHMMSSAFSSIFTRKPVSLPVKIFEPKSTLQRITEHWSFAPVFLSKASRERDNIEKLKYVICYSIAGLYPSSKQLKPFNPLLGETFEGFFEDNSSVYCEHIGHYPSVTRFFIKDVNKMFTFSGFYEYISKPKSMGGKLIVSQKGPNRVDFTDSNYIIYNMPKIKLLNCRSETKRSNIWKSIMVFADVTNNLKAIVRFGKNEELINNFEGYIINYNYPKNYKFHVDEEITLAKKIFKDNKTHKLSKINGNWLENLSFDNKVYWHIDTHLPSWVCPSQNILPSDGRFREDIIWLFRSFNAKNEVEKKKYEEYSQKWKHLIETIQRKDRELRKKN